MKFIPYSTLFLLVYKLEDDSKIKEIVEVFSSVGMSRLLKSEVSIGVLNKKTGPKEDLIQAIKTLSDLAFSSKDILELVF